MIESKNILAKKKKTLDISSYRSYIKIGIEKLILLDTWIKCGSCNEKVNRKKVVYSRFNEQKFPERRW